MVSDYALIFRAGIGKIPVRNYTPLCGTGGEGILAERTVNDPGIVFSCLHQSRWCGKGNVPEYMKWIRKHIITLVLVLIALAGTGLIVYPTFADWWNSFHQTRAVAAYAGTVARLDSNEYDRLINEAEAYNKKLAGTGILWKMTDKEKAEYESLLDVTGTGIMGYIDIPKIQIKLPIYHGTEDSILQIAIGHIAGSSLPVGGATSHCIVSGHRGLPSARLFTDLDKLEEGDTWTLNIMDRTLTYETDQVRVVEPTDLSELQMEQGKDYCTLVTCTPYGINTERLLIRGHRIENAQGEAKVIADALQIRPVYIAPFAALPLLLLLFALMMMEVRKQAADKKAREKAFRQFAGRTLKDEHKDGEQDR